MGSFFCAVRYLSLREMKSLFLLLTSLVLLSSAFSSFEKFAKMHKEMHGEMAIASGAVSLDNAFKCFTQATCGVGCHVCPFRPYEILVCVPEGIPCGVDYNE